MKKIKSKSMLIATILGTLILSGCQGLPRPATSNNDVTSSDSSAIESSLDSFSSSNAENASVHQTEYGVTIIKERNEAYPKGEYTFRVDSLNEEFYIKNTDLFTKTADGDKRFIYDVIALYLADVNKDGYEDFIFSSNARSKDSAGTWLGIYDYHNSQHLYVLDEPDQFDYDLDFISGKFIVNKISTDHYTSKNVLDRYRLVGKGILDYSGDGITTTWQNFLNIDSYDFSVTLVDKDRTPVEVKSTYETDVYVVNASVDNAYCITTNIKRNSGNYDDLTENLPVGYRLNDDYRIVQSIANNKQDNVIISLDSPHLRYKDSKSAVVEVCVSNIIYKIVFQIESYDYAISHKTLMQKFGWNFKKSEVVEFAREYIPGPRENRYSEETYPFVMVSVASGWEATETSYYILEALVVEVHPSLVKKTEYSSQYIFKTRNNKYSCVVHGAIFEYNDAFYLIVYSKNYDYAFSKSDGYVRLRDARKDLTVDAYVSGLQSQVVHNATDIRFKQRSFSSTAEKESLKNNASYTFTIAGNQFYIIDAKTMVMGSSKYEVVSDADFSSLFPTHN